MRILLLLPLLMLFVVPLGIERLSVVRDWHSSQSPSASIAPASSNSTSSTASANAAPQKESLASIDTLAAVEQTNSATVARIESEIPDASMSSMTFIDAVEYEVLRLSNIERAVVGLSSLTHNQMLRDIAWHHSADMITNDYFDHTNKSGCTSSCRVSDAGYRWRTVGENLYMMSGFEVTPEETAAMVVDGWMDSPGHRANLLGENFTESGIGVVSDGDNVYVTALYARPR